MQHRLSLATLFVLLFGGWAAAADLAPRYPPKYPDGPRRRPWLEERLVPSCDQGDDLALLKCPPQIEMPFFASRPVAQVLEVKPVYGRPYRQLFDWSD